MHIAANQASRRIGISARPRLAGLMLVAVALGVSGCATWAPSSMWPSSMWPGSSGSKTATKADPYGPTANQRMEKLTADATTAKAGAPETHEAFTRQLVEMLLSEHDPRVRCRIVDIASEFNTSTAVAICTGALQDPDERVRMAACSAWGRRGGPEAIDLLAARYQNDPELDVRLRAIRALGELRDAAAVPVLAKALEDGDPAVQYRAVAALKQASGRDLGNDVNRWREWAADPEGSGAEWSIAETFRRLF